MHIQSFSRSWLSHPSLEIVQVWEHLPHMMKILVVSHFGRYWEDFPHPKMKDIQKKIPCKPPPSPFFLFPTFQGAFLGRGVWPTPIYGSLQKPKWLHCNLGRGFFTGNFPIPGHSRGPALGLGVFFFFWGGGGWCQKISHWRFFTGDFFRRKISFPFPRGRVRPRANLTRYIKFHSELLGNLHIFPHF